MSVINDPVMGLTIPIAGSEPGEAYAAEITIDLQRIANHTHTGASALDGYQIPSAGININADLSAQSHNLTNLRSTRMVSQSSTLVGVGDLDCLYVVNGNLYFNNGSGTPVEITAGAVVNVTATNNYNTVSINSNTTIGPSDVGIFYPVDCSSGTVLVTLPQAANVPPGRFYLFKDIKGQSETHNITIQTAGDTMDGGSSTKLTAAYQAVIVIGDGVSDWSIFPLNRVIYNTGETVKFHGATESFVDGYLSMDAGSTASLAGRTSIVGQLTVSGAVVNSGNTPYTIGTTNPLVYYFVDTTGSAVTINLPHIASIVAGTKLTIVDIAGKLSTNALTIHPVGGDTISGAVGGTNKIVIANFTSITLVADGSTNWIETS